MILAGVKWKTCLFNVDDTIVFSKTPEEHLAHLEEILELQSKATVSLKSCKCFLIHDEVKHRRRIVCQSQLRVNEKNLSGRRQAKARNKKDLRSLLGMRNVYRRFVTDYAKVARTPSPCSR